jgi:sigma-E factor negative regulatory protein RseA
MNEELDSQLSAMFDDELPPEECELLARRLSRDEQLKARWGRYAVIGAAIRAERGVRLNARVAGRVNARIVSEPALSAGAEPSPRAFGRRLWWQPLAGTAVAAGVAAAAILWLRGQLPPAVSPALTAQVSTAQVSAATHSAAAALPGVSAPNGGEPVSYVVPSAPATGPAALVPSTELANYVVAHSVFSPPVARRNLLSAFMSSGEALAVAAPAVSGYDAQHDAQSHPQ